MLPKVFLITFFTVSSVCLGSGISLDCSSLPSAQGWDFLAPSSIIEEDIVSVIPGDVLELDTIGWGYRAYSPGATYRRYDAVSTEPVEFELSFTARCLMEEIDAFWTPQTFYFSVVVNNLAYGVVLGEHEISLCKGGLTPWYIWPFDNTEFHSYVLRGTPGDNVYTVTVDGTYVFQGIAEPSSSNCIAFGDGSGTGNARGEIASLTFSQVSHNTLPGSNVVVTPVDPGTGMPSPVTLAFDEVTVAGDTTVTTSSTGPFIPTQLKLGSPPVYFDITTDATFSGAVIICIDYSGIQFGNESQLRLLHRTDVGWEDVTTLLDMENRVVFGEVLSLSPFAVVETNLSPVAHAVADTYAAQVNEEVMFDGAASIDPDGTVADYEWTCDGTTISTGPEAAYSFSAPDVYEVVLTVWDDTGAQHSDPLLVAVYDPSAGFVTGGGWIDSPAGAYTADPILEDKANFGFVSKYKNGATVPTGQTEFVFRAGDLNFHSDNYDWLVVTGSNYARFKGTGAINGYGAYRFMLWAGDGDSDTFRIKIWWEDGEVENVIYDNGMDQPIGGGSIVIHAN